MISPGEKAQVSLFGLKGEGSKFVYVLDRSGSTDGKLISAAKAEILASIEKIDDVHQFHLSSTTSGQKFNPAGRGGQLAFGTDANREEVKKFLAGISGDGGTDHAAALSMAIRMHPDVIFMLSDGDDPKLTDHDLERIDRIGAGIIIHTVQFGEDHKLEHGFMEKLAKQSGGEYKFVDTTKLGGEEAAQILGMVESQETYRDSPNWRVFAALHARINSPIVLISSAESSIDPAAAFSIACSESRAPQSTQVMPGCAAVQAITNCPNVAPCRWAIGSSCFSRSLIRETFSGLKRGFAFRRSPGLYSRSARSLPVSRPWDSGE